MAHKSYYQYARNACCRGLSRKENRNRQKNGICTTICTKAVKLLVIPFVLVASTEHSPVYTNADSTYVAYCQQDTLRKIRETVSFVSESYGIDSLLALSLVEVESQFDPHAYNNASGCAGLFQLNPRYFQLENIYDIDSNTEWGVWYLACLLEQFNNDTLQALTAYNSGPNSDRAHLGTSDYANKIMRLYRTKTLLRGKRLNKPVRAELPYGLGDLLN